ncbi:MAG: AraC family transcriptional regulator [Oscillospiraceae bacterium]|nr:AraC family transcriptional regulator [Oscillospiraceae bacterium]
MSIVTCHTVTDERGRELIEHGTALFPVSFCEDFLAREAVPWHWHEEMEAVWVERGTAVAAAGAERFLLRPGECVFVNAGVLHADWQEGGELCVLHSVVFHPRLVGGGMDSVFWHDYLQPLLSDPSLSSLQLDGSEPWRQEALNAALAAFDAGAEEAPGYEFAVREQLSRLVFLLARNRPRRPVRPSGKALRDEERMKQMLRFIQGNLDRELTAGKIAASASLSASECLRCFHSVIGATPMQYVKQLRLRRAAQLLGSTELAVAEIGARCGFQEMSYFTKAFKAFRGQTPTEYRRSLGGSGKSSCETDVCVIE